MDRSLASPGRMAKDAPAIAEGHAMLEPPGTSLPNDAVARARGLATLVSAAAGRIEAAREVPDDVMAALHRARLFRLALPRSIGGEEASLATLAEVAEVIAAADASTAWCIGQATGCAHAAAWLSPEAAREVFGPADAVLAWGAGAVGRAIAVPGGYKVTGSWPFASGSRKATWLGGHCRVVEADGRPRLRPDGRPSERTAFFPRAAARIDDVWQVMGLRGTGSDTYAVDGLVVADAFTIDRESAEERREPGPLYRFSGSLVYAACFGGVMLGIARSMLDDLKALALTKTPRGAVSSLKESAIFHTDLARLEARLGAARAYHLATYAGAWAAVAGGAPVTLDLRIGTRLAATHAINEAFEVATAAYRAAGQSAIFEAAPFERRMRDALSASQQVQARPSHYTTAGRHLLGLAPDTMLFM